MIGPEFFKKNRDQIAKKLSGGIIVLSAYTKMQRGNDAAFDFEQEANFWYLSGIESSDWWLIIDGVRKRSWLVSPEISESHQIFDGSLSKESAIKISGVDDVLSRDDAETMLRDLARRHSVVYTLGEQPYASYLDFHLNPAIHQMWQRLDRMFTTVQDLRKDMTQLRAVKQPEEIAAIKAAIKLTTNAFSAVREQLPTMRYEYEIEAAFTHYFRSHGAAGHAYDPIVASGANACTLHYHTNNERLKKPGSVLLDIGARHNGYAADISRTYTLAQPTKRLAALHLAVEKSHHQIISLLRPGLKIEDYERQVAEIMKNALRELGLIKSSDDTEAYRRYFPHAISHGLGIDVHDSLGRPAEFTAGMVLTVEPGIYISEEGRGVRIEDDILITDSGHENLSRSLSTSL